MKFQFYGSIWRDLLLLFAFFGFSFVTQTALANEPATSIAEVEKTIRAEMKNKGVQGLSIAVIHDGQVDWARGYGVTDYKTKAPVSNKTTFQAASLGKMSAAYATMILVESQEISLDQPLSHPRLRVADGCSTPTVRQALSHMTGMDNDFFAPIYAPDCQPGTQFNYSGQGFSALGETISSGAGKPAADAINELVFTPLGMELTRYGDMLGASTASGHISYLSLLIGRAVFGSPVWLALSGALAILLMLVLPAIIMARTRGLGSGAATFILTLVGFSLILFVGTRIPAKRHISIDSHHIAASLTSTAEDLAKFGAELMRPTLVSSDSRNLMFSQQTDQPGCIQWALGIGIDKCSDTATYWHWGSNLGFESLFVLDPENGNGVVILTNTGGGLDTVVPGRGGHEAAKIIAREILGVDGVWDL